MLFIDWTSIVLRIGMCSRHLIHTFSFFFDTFACIVVLWVFVLCNPAISVGLQREEVKGREHEFPCFWFYSSINNQESENIRDPGWAVGSFTSQSNRSLLWTCSQSGEAEGFFWRALCWFPPLSSWCAVFHESLHTRQPACCLSKYRTATTNMVVRVMFQLPPVLWFWGNMCQSPLCRTAAFLSQLKVTEQLSLKRRDRKKTDRRKTQLYVSPYLNAAVWICHAYVVGEQNHLLQVFFFFFLNTFPMLLLVASNCSGWSEQCWEKIAAIQRKAAVAAWSLAGRMREAHGGMKIPSALACDGVSLFLF